MEGREFGYIPEEKTQILDEKVGELQSRFDGVNRLDKENDVPKEEINFVNNGVDLLLEKKKFGSLLKCLRIGVLSADQETKVLEKIVQEESTPEVIFKLCEVIGRDNCGERLSPNLIDYVAQSKDLTSEEVISADHTNSPYGLTYLFGDRSHRNYSNLAEVPNWALSRIWEQLIDKKPADFSKFIAKHISEGTLNKEYESSGLNYVLNNLTLESAVPLLDSRPEDVNKRLERLSPEETNKMVDEWWKTNPSVSETFETINSLVQNKSVFKELKNLYGVSEDKKIKPTVGVINLGGTEFNIKSSFEISPTLYPIEDFLAKRIDDKSKINDHSIDGFKQLIRTYQNKMPDEAKDFFINVINLGLKSRIKSESEKYHHPMKSLLKKVIFR